MNEKCLLCDYRHNRNVCISDRYCECFEADMLTSFNVPYNLINRAKQLIDSNHGILYRSSISILRTGLKLAKESNNFSDLQEFVPIFEKKYKRLKLQREKERLEREARKIRDITLLFKSYTKEVLFNRLDRCKKESLELKEKWSALRIDERTQRKATISNRADANAKEMMLIQDALTYLKKNKLRQI